MFCSGCGKKITKNNKFCPGCGKEQSDTTKEVPVVVEEKVIEQKPIKEEQPNNHLANVLCSISLALYFGMPIVSFVVYMFTFGLSFNNDSAVSAIGTFFTSIMSLLSSVSTLAAYVLMIIARVKCPKSTYAKVVMWLYIALFVMGLITLVVVMITCAGILAECGRNF